MLSRKFRGKFLDFTNQALQKEQLNFKGILSLSTAKDLYALTSKLSNIEWVVNIQPPFGDARKVLEYLSRYVFRIAITNRRIIEIKDNKVLFSWKDYRTGRFRKMKLEIDEFIRRFLLHVLPKGFFKVRYYGIFSSGWRRKNIEISRQLLADEKHHKQQEQQEDGMCVCEKRQSVWDEILSLIENYKKPNCPKCKKGKLRFAGIVPVESFVPG